MQKTIKTILALMVCAAVADQGANTLPDEQLAAAPPPPRRLRGSEPSCGFRAFFERNKAGPGIHKWLHYFSAYEQEFSRHCGAGAVPAKMIEIGIQSGGSMRMWRECFGANLEALVGIDVNAATKAWERFGDEPGSRPGNVHVEVGSQADPAVFKDIDAKYPGGFDIILDDGSHVNTHMVASFRAAWRLLRPGGVYLIEDITKENVRAVHDIILSAAHPYKDGVRVKGHTILDAMYDNAGPACCETAPNSVQREIEYVKMYPMMLAIKKHEAPLAELKATQHGTRWIPYRN